MERMRLTYMARISRCRGFRRGQESPRSIRLAAVAAYGGGRNAPVPYAPYYLARERFMEMP